MRVSSFYACIAGYHATVRSLVCLRAKAFQSWLLSKGRESYNAFNARVDNLIKVYALSISMRICSFWFCQEAYPLGAEFRHFVPAEGQKITFTPLPSSANIICMPLDLVNCFQECLLEVRTGAYHTPQGLILFALNVHTELLMIFCFD